MRRTVNQAVTFHGVGMHGGQPVVATVAPAAAQTGIVFHRSDAGPAARPIPARYDCVIDTHLRTGLANDDGLAVGTAEHLMAALAGCGVSDARITLDGPEVPIMDGSAAVFVREFARVGIRDLDLPWPAIRVLEPVSVRMQDKLAELAPAPRFEMDFTISFADPAIGRQSRHLVLTGGAIFSELSDSRTFGCLANVEALRRNGLGRGGSLENAVIVDNGRVLNPGGLRHPESRRVTRCPIFCSASCLPPRRHGPGAKLGRVRCQGARCIRPRFIFGKLRSWSEARPEFLPTTPFPNRREPTILRREAR